jgi:hypothetical protein
MIFSMFLFSILLIHQLSAFDDQRERFQAQADQKALAGVHVLVDAIKFPGLYMAHQADIFNHLNVKPPKNGSVKVFHAEIIVIRKPVTNFNFRIVVMGARTHGHAGKRSKLLFPREGDPRRGDVPGAVLAQQIHGALKILGGIDSYI